MDRTQATGHALGEYLRACRSRVDPGSRGLPDDGRRRRVPGLRREELAVLSGVSVDYLVRLEQGRAQNVSRSVLDALARALDLRPDEHAYLLEVAEPLSRPGQRPSSAAQVVSRQTRQLLDAVTGLPAMVLGRRMEVLAWNPLAAALYTDFSRLPAAHRSLTWISFLDPGVRAMFQNWDEVVRDCVAYLRMDAVRYPGDPKLAALVGELSVKDEDFRRWWADHRVRAQGAGRKTLLHPVAGPLTLDYQTMDLREADQMLVVYTAEPSSRSEEALRFLANWAEELTPGETEGVDATG
ncbi:transcriptional regulator with XRE-family HTH domain [Crossiella equi]|uniref:Transcriptional regulator with XRE-family HTH domain n=1 Tax=Crossiella equi TaxID=130796 RepID=A0ABS5ACX5_9PSEU|nr:helix-turn-helix transcriptional regulator [Crossiella equi]MBP2474438.1 transcriptional regulator with XRE-family HTH domain [Crossiella equi]